MRKLFLLVVMVPFLLSSLALAAGSSVTESYDAKGIFGRHNEFKTVSFACVGDDTTGAIADTDFSSALMTELKQGGYCLFKVQTIYGVTPPLDDSDVIIKDSNDIDILGGAGADMLDNAANNEFLPLIGTDTVLQPVVDQLTLDVDGQTNVDATYTIICIFIKKP